MFNILWQNEEKLASLKSELSLQEAVYHEAYKKHTEMSENFDKEVKELYKVTKVVEDPLDIFICHNKSCNLLNKVLLW